ncbi:MAG: hypothetical protein KGL39_48710 [Patescibacteria group bacterium]|nr:hypothetical protein [Patescibacteria group bacterium]
MTQVIEFRPKGVKRRKVALEDAVQQIVDAKPAAVVFIGSCEDGSLMLFTGGQRCSEANWLIDLAKAALVNGEMSRDE